MRIQTIAQMFADKGTERFALGSIQMRSKRWKPEMLYVLQML